MISMGPRSIAIPVLVSVLAVTASARWIPAFDPFAWSGPVSSRWPRLGVPLRDGTADLSGVEIEYFRWGAPPCFTTRIRGDGSAHASIEMNLPYLGDAPFTLAPTQVAGLLDGFESLDFMRVQERRGRPCSDAAWYRLRLTIGDHRRSYTYSCRPGWNDKRSPNFYPDFNALVKRVRAECKLDELVGWSEWP